jgi:hypothetical protein
LETLKLVDVQTNKQYNDNDWKTLSEAVKIANGLGKEISKGTIRNRMKSNKVTWKKDVYKVVYMPDVMDIKLQRKNVVKDVVKDVVDINVQDVQDVLKLENFRDRYYFMDQDSKILKFRHIGTVEAKPEGEEYKEGESWKFDTTTNEELLFMEHESWVYIWAERVEYSIVVKIGETGDRLAYRGTTEEAFDGYLCSPREGAQGRMNSSMNKKSIGQTDMVMRNSLNKSASRGLVSLYAIPLPIEQNGSVNGRVIPAKYNTAVEKFILDDVKKRTGMLPSRNRNKS